MAQARTTPMRASARSGRQQITAANFSAGNQSATVDNFNGRVAPKFRACHTRPGRPMGLSEPPEVTTPPSQSASTPQVADTHPNGGPGRAPPEQRCLHPHPAGRRRPTQHRTVRHTRTPSPRPKRRPHRTQYRRPLAGRPPTTASHTTCACRNGARTDLNSAGRLPTGARQQRLSQLARASNGSNAVVHNPPAAWRPAPHHLPPTAGPAHQLGPAPRPTSPTSPPITRCARRRPQDCHRCPRLPGLHSRPPGAAPCRRPAAASHTQRLIHQRRH